MSTIAQRVLRRVQDRVLTAELGKGQTFFSGTLKIHRYHDSLRITDLENAGKRGKTCPEITVTFGFSLDSAAEDALATLTQQVVKCTSFDCVRRTVEQFKVNSDKSSQIAVYDEKLRSIDVEPMGTRIKYKTRTGLEIEASPNDFNVVEHAPMGMHDGKPNFYQDTAHWPCKKQDGRAFYTWVKENFNKLNSMTMRDLKEVWRGLGVCWNSH